MHMLRILPAVATLGLMFVTAAPALAQSSSTAPAASPLGGPVVPGVCLLSREAIFANAKVGKAATARLQQLAQQAKDEVEAQRKPVDADIQAFRKQAAALKPDERQSREQALGQRMQAVQAHAAQLGREIEATRAKALARIAQAAEPAIASAYANKGCGLLISRDVVLGGNTSNDLTPAVVQGLDAKLTTITFERETLPAQGNGAAQ
jgi:Skp family chaperone for outer membrane proteins